MVQNQGEVEESEESMDSKFNQNQEKKSQERKANQALNKVTDNHSDASMDDDQDNYNDKTDTQKLAENLELNSPDMEDIDESHNDLKLFDSEENKFNNMLKDIDNQSDDHLRKEDISDGHSRKKSDKRKSHAESNDEMDDDNERYSDLDFYGKNIPDKKQVIVNDEDNEALVMKKDLKPEEHKPSHESNKTK